MQPNQQEPVPQNGSTPPPSTIPTPSVDLEQQPVSPYVSQQPSTIPEYLHLDPIPEPQPKKSHKKFILFAGVVLAAVVLIGGGVTYWSYMSGAPERLFYSALQNSLAVKYVTEKRASQFGADSSSAVTTTRDLDLTDVAAAKTSLTYTAQLPGKAFGSTAETVNVNVAEILFYAEPTFLAKVDPRPAVSSAKGLAGGTWYKLSKSDFTRGHAIDYLDQYTTANPAFGDILMGNFDVSLQSQILSSLHTKNIYTIQDSHSEVLDGKSVTVFTYKADYSALNSLNQQIAKVLNIASTRDFVNSSQKVTTKLWVDESSHIVKQTVTDTSGKKSAVTTYTYPTTSSLATTPASFTDLTASTGN